MARVVYSALVESIQGSIGGTTFQKNAYGYTVKKKPNVIRPASPFQNLRKRNMATMISAWKALDPADRATWDSYANTYPQYSKHNPTAQLSGFNLYCKYHGFRLLTDHGLIDAPSMTQYSIATLDSDSISVDNVAGALHILWDTAGVWTGTWYLCFFLSNILGSAQNYVGSRPRYVAQDFNGGALDITVTTAYTNFFGAVPATGTRVGVRVQAFNSLSAQMSLLQNSVVEVA